MENNSTLRVAAIADMHYDESARGQLRDLFIEATRSADVLLLCGDLTTHGKPKQAQALANDINEYADLRTIGVLGNHDFESDAQDAIVEIMRKAGVTMLDGDSTEIDGVGFAGVRGFGGGFGEFALSAWGEPAIKEFVQAAVDEALKLERALSSLNTEHQIVLMHYAPVAATIEGEPEPIFPFLGSSRLETPLDRFHVTAAFHGHAHHGSPEGRTAQDTPIYNVSLPVLKKAFPDGPPLRIFEIDL